MKVVTTCVLGALPSSDPFQEQRISASFGGKCDASFSPAQSLFTRSAVRDITRIDSRTRLDEISLILSSIQLQPLDQLPYVVAQAMPAIVDRQDTCTDKWLA